MRRRTMDCKIVVFFIVICLTSSSANTDDLMVNENTGSNHQKPYISFSFFDMFGIGRRHLLQQTTNDLMAYENTGSNHQKPYMSFSFFDMFGIGRRHLLQQTTNDLMVYENTGSNHQMSYISFSFFDMFGIGRRHLLQQTTYDPMVYENTGSNHQKPYISFSFFDMFGIGRRNLLQQKTSCPVNFENQNYTIITSQCKGPNYNKTTCCDSFKQFACPHADYISDMKTNCADTLFSYINIYGKYPSGLFANLCSDKDGGVDCEGVQVQQANPSQSSSSILKTNMISVIMTVFGSSLLVLWTSMV